MTSSFPCTSIFNVSAGPRAGRGHARSAAGREESGLFGFVRARRNAADRPRHWSDEVRARDSGYHWRPDAGDAAAQTRNIRAGNATW